MHPADLAKNPSAATGSSLIEVLLFMLVVLALAMVLISSSGVTRKTRSSNLETVAMNIASCQIETDRLGTYPPVTTSTLTSPCDQNLSSLPAGSFQQTVAIAPGASDNLIKQVTVTLSWTDNGNANSISLQTLISKYGLK